MSDNCPECDGFGWTENFDRCPRGCDSSITEVRRGQRNGMVVAREAVARTGEQYGKATAKRPSALLATVKQVAFLTKLIEERDADLNATVLLASKACNYGMGKRAASDWIEAMLAIPATKGAAKAGAAVRTNNYPGKCVTCGTAVAAGAGRIAPRSSGKGWDTFHLDGQCPSVAPVAPVCPSEGLDLAPLAKYGTKQSAGATVVRFGVPGGDTRLKLRVAFTAEGTVWVTDAAHYGQRTTYGAQRPGEAYRGKCADALRTILADPQAAAIRYAELTSTCASCGRPLELETSVAQGMGSVCAGKFGM